MKQNKITQKSRKKMNRSGKTCCCICGTKTILVTHHIEGRKIPNYNHPSNVAPICPNCHNLIHEGVIIIEGWFGTSDGPKLFHHTDQEKSFTGEIKTPYIVPK